MNKSKLVRYLKDLSSKKREKFRLFVSSPYYNRDQKVTELLEILLKGIDSKHYSLEKAVVFERLYPGEAIDQEKQKLYKRLTLLKNLYIRFIALQNYEQQTFAETINALEAAEKEKQFDLFENRFKHLQKLLDNQPSQDAQKYLAQYQSNINYSMYYSEQVSREETTYFKKALKNLDNYYILNKLKICLVLLENRIIVNSQYELELLDELLAFVRNNRAQFKSDLLIELYYLAIMHYKEESEDTYFQEFRERFFERIDQVSETDKQILFSFVGNYHIYKINFGKDKHKKELFKLYQNALEKDRSLILLNNQMSEWKYKNIITLGCSLQSFDWVEHFMESFKDKLPANLKENAYIYNLSFYHFARHRYEKSLQHLQSVRFTDLAYQLNVNLLLLRIFYKLEQVESLLSLCESFRVFILRNKKISESQKEAYQNVIRFVKRLNWVKSRLPILPKEQVEKDVKAISKMLGETTNILLQSWFKEECNLLIEASYSQMHPWSRQQMH